MTTATTHDATGDGAIVWALGVTQVIGYGTLYYAFSIVAASIARDLDWSLEWVFAAFSASLLVGGLTAPISGRWIDRFGAGRVMVLGSLGAALALAATALAPERISFVLGLVLVEAISTLVLYDSAFAALVQVSGQGAKRSITRLTLIGGFASTLFWPLTGLLLEVLTWREIFLLFAALHVLVCAPLHLMLARRLRSQSGAAHGQVAAPVAKDVQGSLPPEARRVAFLLLLVGFSAGGVVLSGVLVHMVPVLGALGLGSAALLVGTVFGPAQVLSRLVNMVFGNDLAPTRLAVISASFLPVAIVVLLLTAPSLPAALLFAMIFGLGSGLVSIVRGTVPLLLFGSQGYGALLGKITAVRLVATAGAPFAFALLLERLGPVPALWSMVGIALLGVLALIGLMSLSSRAASVTQPSGSSTAPTKAA